jgi:hypothetical protein
VKDRSHKSARKAVLSLAALFASPVIEANAFIVLSREADALRHATSFPGDPVGFEAFVNHVHLGDIVASSAGRLERRDLIRVGGDVVQVWSDRLKGILGGREILFYLGGARGVTLRFHVVREGEANWLDLSDKEFIRKEKMAVFRLTSEGLQEIL